MLTSRDIRIINACRAVLTKRLQPVILENGRASEAVDKSTVLSLQNMISESDIYSDGTDDQIINDELLAQAHTKDIELAKLHWSREERLEAVRIIKNIGAAMGFTLKSSLEFCQRNFPPPKK